MLVTGDELTMTKRLLSCGLLAAALTFGCGDGNLSPGEKCSGASECAPGTTCLADAAGATEGVCTAVVRCTLDRNQDWVCPADGGGSCVVANLVSDECESWPWSTCPAVPIVKICE